MSIRPVHNYVTLQRRVQLWRNEQVKRLIFEACGIHPPGPEIASLSLNVEATTNIGNWLQASLADGNSMTLNVGKVTSAGGVGIITYKKNATAANSTFCLDVYGGSSTLCVDGSTNGCRGRLQKMVAVVGLPLDDKWLPT